MPSLKTKIDTFVQNMQKLDSVINGSDTTSVDTPSGALPSIAKLFKDNLISPILNMSLLANKSLSAGGAALIGYDGATVQDVLDSAKAVSDYTALRNYTGRASTVRITQAALAGFFWRDDADTTSADNGGTIIVAANSKRWKRIYDGFVNVKWFNAKGDGVTNDTTALQAALNTALWVEIPDTGNTYKTTLLTLRAGTILRGPGKLGIISGTVLLNVPFAAHGALIENLDLTYQDGTYGRGAIVIGSTGGSAGNFTSDVTVRGCRITGNIFLSRTARARITDNRITNGSVQFDGWYDSAVVMRNHITHDNSFTPFNGIGASAVDSSAAKHGASIISHNIISVYRMGIEWRDRDGTTVINNDTKSVMSNNVIRVNGTDINTFGISLNSHGWNISDNSIEKLGAYSGGTMGMEIVDSCYNVISGNAVAGFDKGISVYGVASTTRAKGNSVVANRITGCLTGIQVWRYTEDTRVEGNYIEFISSAATTNYAIQADGDSGATDGTLGRHGWRAIITGNNIVADTTANANAYNMIFVAYMTNSVVANNTVAYASGSASGRHMYVVKADNLLIEGNRFVGTGGVACTGLVLWQQCGRRLKIVRNVFDNLAKGMDNSGGNPFYSVQVSDNTENNCATTSRVFPSSFAFSSNGNKVAYASAQPSLGTWVAGDTVFNTGSATGWKCSVGGTAGALPSVTATTTASSTTVTLNTLENVEEGQSITIAGVSGNKKVVSIDRTNATIKVDVAADVGVAAAAVAYVAPTFVALPF